MNMWPSLPPNLKHSKQILSVCGGHLISVNISLRNELSFAYYLRVQGPYTHKCKCKVPPTPIQ
jgi:hypothetical protein